MILIIVLSMVAVMPYTVAGLSIFAEDCVLHIKRFHDSFIAVDINSIVIQPPIQANIQPMVSLFSANASTTSIRPEMGKKREECSL
jgi:hypothetical protein